MTAGTVLDEADVATFLDESPQFLEEYILSTVDPVLLQKWLYMKMQRKDETRRKSLASIGSAVSLSQQEEVLSWRIGLHSSWCKGEKYYLSYMKRHPNMGIILANIVQSAARISRSSAFNFFLFNESTNSLERCSNVDECIQTGVKLELKSFSPSPEQQYLRNLSSGTIAIVNDKVGSQWVLALAIKSLEEELLGVLELFRSEEFTSFEEDLLSRLLSLENVGLPCSEVHEAYEKQAKMVSFLLNVTKSIFQEIVSMDTLIIKIMNFAKELVTADRASLFLVDSSTQELYARIFDTGGKENNYTAEKEIRFPMNRGIAGYVASTGNTLNIPDAYADNRFNRAVDVQTGYRTRNILCMPVMSRGRIIGVVQMINKLAGDLFTRHDEKAFESFAVYCGLALYHAKLYEKLRRSEQKYRVALDILCYHSTATDDEYEMLRKNPLPANIDQITDCHFSPWDVEDKPLCVLYMFKELFSTMRFTYDTFVRFTLTVKKNYRNIAYHNWHHAFSVAHAMFTIIKRSENHFSALERLAMFVACLCHDLDHRGKTNSYMVKSSSPLAAVYTTSTMEQHHFNMTVMILQQDRHNIFKHLNSDSYKKVLDLIRHCIIATDLALFFTNRAKLKQLSDAGDFSWESEEHRNLLMAVQMTGSDLCTSYKPWDTHIDNVGCIMEEFWQQGDEEKIQGNQPIPMMDREKAYELAQCQAGFIIGICLPCYELLSEVLPPLVPMVDGCKGNLEIWWKLEKHSKQPDEIFKDKDLHKKL